MKTNKIPFKFVADWQEKAFKDTSKYVLLSGTAGSGKSRVVGEKADAFARHYPGSSLLFVKKTFASINNTMIVPFENQVLRGFEDTYIHQKSKHYFEYNNGSVIFYAGMANEKERQRIRGIGTKGGLDFIWVDEGIQLCREDYEELYPRLRGTAAPWRQLIITTNPDSPSHYLYQEFILGKKGNCYFSSYKDNYYNPNDYGDILSMNSGVMLQRLRDGEWVQAEGAIYPEFNPYFHVIEPFLIPPHWRRIRTVDFGFKNPFVCQWWAIDHDGAMYMYRELYAVEKIVEDMAKKIVELSKGEKIEATITDHDAEDAATLNRHGIPTVRAEKFKTFHPGMQSIKERLRVMKNGKARMYFFRDAIVNPDSKLISNKMPYCTVEEFGRYVFDKDKDEPLKENDHGMDAMRYGVIYIDKITEKQSYVLDDATKKKLDAIFDSKYKSAYKPAF